MSLKFFSFSKVSNLPLFSFSDINSLTHIWVYIFYLHIYTYIPIVILFYMCVCVCVWSWFSSVQLFVTPWTISHQVPLSLGFSRQKYWSRLPCHPPGDLPHPGSNSCLLKLCTTGEFFTTEPPESPLFYNVVKLHLLSYNLVLSFNIMYF